jgi:hypothetical protein
MDDGGDKVDPLLVDNAFFPNFVLLCLKLVGF